MKTVVVIVLSLLTTSFAYGQNKKEYQYNNNIPTRYGIQHYIDRNKKNIVSTVENFFGDSLVSYNIKVDDLSEYQQYDSLQAGRFYPEDEIIITDQPKYFDYELPFVPKWRQKEFDHNTRFVKGTLIHELTHLYIYQFIYQCLDNNIPINTEFLNFNVVSSMRSYYASEFIEEGICEYVVMKLREGIFSEYMPDCLEDSSSMNIKKFTQIQETYGIKYQYSRIYVQRIFEKYPFKKALMIILTCRPPSYAELLCPDKYYSRLMRHAEDL